MREEEHEGRDREHETPPAGKDPEIDPPEEPSIGHSGGEVETGWDEKTPNPAKK